MIYPWVKSRGELPSLEQLQFRDDLSFSGRPRNQAEKFCRDWVGEFSCKMENIIKEGQCGTSGFMGKGGGSYCEPGGINTWAGYYQMKELMVIREMCPETCDSVPVADNPDFAFFGEKKDYYNLYPAEHRRIGLLDHRPHLSVIGVKCSVWA